MATTIRPPDLDRPQPAAGAAPTPIPEAFKRAAAARPGLPTRPTADAAPFSPGPLSAWLGALAVVLMALMVATNFVLAQRAGAPAPAGAAAAPAAAAPAAQ